MPAALRPSQLTLRQSTLSQSILGDTPVQSFTRLADERAIFLDQDAPGSPPPLRLLVVAARHDLDGPAARIMAACAADAGAEDRGFEARLLCGAAGLEPPPGIRIFQPFPDGSFLAEAELGYDANDHSQHDADLLRRLSAWLADWPPDLVHLHDLAPFGMELIGLIRRQWPAARILLSLSPLRR